MSYTGAVRTLGEPAVRELTGLTVHKASVSAMDNNAYLLTCTTTGAQLLIDAADSAERIEALVSAGSSHGLDTVVTTHAHADHWQALAAVVDRFDAVTAAGSADVPGIPVPTGTSLSDGDTIRVGDAVFGVIGLRGHTPGSVAIVYEEPGGIAHLFTGDSLFPGGVGRTTSQEDFAQLHGDVVERIFDRFGDDAWVYPGHGDDTTLGAERPSLDEWRRRGW